MVQRKVNRSVGCPGAQHTSAKSTHFYVLIQQRIISVNLLLPSFRNDYMKIWMLKLCIGKQSLIDDWSSTTTSEAEASIGLLNDESKTLKIILPSRWGVEPRSTSNGRPVSTNVITAKSKSPATTDSSWHGLANGTCPPLSTRALRSHLAPVRLVGAALQPRGKITQVVALVLVKALWRLR